jgi:hypothetical protein
MTLRLVGPFMAASFPVRLDVPFTDTFARRRWLTLR